ncbi:hypothetical protein [Sulfitobacter dubius]|uniref:hypothetical protein n=1 Tax=Sulfitobacter dubius TaxID=218673 RepID=UPI0029428F3B|nr:hypothetical protein [Sulfitobacter dubius]WOI31295.1 hypothetical protein R1T39_18780 [Sulfitobacter dubius]
MTIDSDKMLLSTLHMLEQEAPEEVMSTTGITMPSRQDVARKSLHEALEMATAALPDQRAKPVLRTVHHLACTGGTIISKAISSQPNVALLSEVDPFSPMGHEHPFRPTDMIGLAKVGSRAATIETQGKMFLSSLAILAKEYEAQGTYLVLRDHSHGKYNYGSDIASYHSLRALLSDTYDLKSVVTIRDPIDSYLSLKKNGWEHFSPSGFDEYCRRMLVFLDDHSDVPIIKYEDFVTDPQNVCAALCMALDLPFNSNFIHLMSAISISGDSGRKGEKLQLRPRREIIRDERMEFKASHHHAKLAKRLGYSTDLAGH